VSRLVNAAEERRRDPFEGVLAGLVILLLPLMALALIDIAQGDENLNFEWSIVLLGLVVIAAEQVEVFVRLGKRR
jgi:hypothetical protein